MNVKVRVGSASTPFSTSRVVSRIDIARATCRITLLPALAVPAQQRDKQRVTLAAASSRVHLIFHAVCSFLISPQYKHAVQLLVRPHPQSITPIHDFEDNHSDF